MMNKKVILLFLAMLPFVAFGQNKANDSNENAPFLKRTSREAGLTIASSGNLNNISLNGMQYWGVGKGKRKFKVGAGLRLNNYFGNDKLEYITAPADLTGDEATIDTLSTDGTQVSALNLFIALRYDITERFGIEFNIDVAGFSLGAEKEGTLIHNDGKTLPGPLYPNHPELNAQPAQGNILLIGDNDIGNLNSEFLLTYRYKTNLRFKAGAMFNFNEYMTDLVLQPYTASNGTIVDGVQRYRSKNMTFGIGVNYIF